MLALVVTPLGCSGRRQIWLARVAATNSILPSALRRCRLGWDGIDQAGQHTGSRVAVNAPSRVLQAGLPLIGEVDVTVGWRTPSRLRP